MVGWRSSSGVIPATNVMEECYADCALGLGARAGQPTYVEAESYINNLE